MPRSKSSSSRPSSDPPTLENVVEDLIGEVQKLTDQVEMLRIAIDDLRCEVEHGIRNLARNTWMPTQNPTIVRANETEETKKDDVAATDVQANDEPTTPPAPDNAKQRGLWD